MEYTKTELHTHLIGMLSTKGFIDLINRYTDYIYWPLDKAMEDSTTRLVRIDDVRDKLGQYLEYQDGSEKSMDYYYRNRSNILFYLQVMKFLQEYVKIESMSEAFRDERIKQYIIDAFQENRVIDVVFLKAISRYYEDAKSKDNSLGDCFKNDIFNEYINMALSELINMGIEYAEISYSNGRIIEKIKVDEDIQEKITFRFLLSTDRVNKLKYFKQSARDLSKLLEEGKTVGFDIMGEERELEDIEKVYNASQNSKSIKAKLEVLVNIMKDYPVNQATLRIHSGETKVSVNNTEFIVDTLLAIKDEYKKGNPPRNVFPPPEFRIGHGIKFHPSQDYIDKLKELGAIIEINATSNKMLGNINDYSEIPYDYYLQNGIPIVICTDGHGVVKTTTGTEDVIAMINSDDYEKIIENDASILERKKTV